MLKLTEFYRIKTWYKNMGMAAIGVLSAPVFDPVLALIGVIQVFLIQLHSFSMNDYYDYRRWGEKTYVGSLVENNWSINTLLLLMLAPLLAALSFFPISGWATVTLLVYSGLFYLYQGPTRLKNHWLLSIVLNAVPLGWVVYANPYLVLSTQLTPIFIFFSAIFLFYMAFFEVAHQIEHQEEEEDVYSIVDAIGIKNALIVGGVFQVIPVATGALLYIIESFNPLLVLTAAIFTGFRLYRIKSLGLEPEKLRIIRRSWHKFYTAFEGALYIALLIILDLNYWINILVQLANTLI